MFLNELKLPLPLRVFSLNFWWGGPQIFWSPSVPDGDEVGWGGGNLAKKSDWSPNCTLNAKSDHFFAILSMKYSFSQIWHKNVFKFFKFSGTNLGGGGTSLGPKTGTSVGWGDWQNFCQMGGPPSPPRKKTLSGYECFLLLEFVWFTFHRLNFPISVMIYLV